MRIGKPAEHLQAAVKAAAIGDPILKLLAIVRQLGYAVYLFNDQFLWVRLAKPAHPNSRLTEIISRSFTLCASKCIAKTATKSSTGKLPDFGPSASVNYNLRLSRLVAHLF